MEVVFCFKILRVCLKNQDVLFNAFLTIFYWYLCDKYTKSKHNFKFSYMYQIFLKTRFTAHRIFMSQKESVQCSSYHFSCFKFFSKTYSRSIQPQTHRLIVTKKLNFDIQNVMYAFVLNDCYIPHQGFKNFCQFVKSSAYSIPLPCVIVF